MFHQTKHLRFVGSFSEVSATEYPEKNNSEYMQLLWTETYNLLFTTGCKVHHHYFEFQDVSLELFNGGAQLPCHKPPV
jgi:hypothetical protein